MNCCIKYENTKKMENSFLELIDIESIEEIGYVNMVDISVTGDESFILGDGIISHNSAVSAVRKFRDPQTFGAFPLRGKFINVSEMTNTEVIKNDEAVQLMASLGIKFGENFCEYETPTKTIKIELNDGTIIEVQDNEEILINEKWVSVKKLIADNRN